MYVAATSFSAVEWIALGRQEIQKQKQKVCPARSFLLYLLLSKNSRGEDFNLFFVDIQVLWFSGCVLLKHC